MTDQCKNRLVQAGFMLVAPENKRINGEVYPRIMARTKASPNWFILERGFVSEEHRDKKLRVVLKKRSNAILI